MKEKKLYRIIIPVIIGMVFLIGVSYAWFTLVLNGTKMNVIKTGNLSLILGEEGNTILLENAFPITTNEGLQSEGYTFEIKNNGDLTSQYTLYFEDDTLEANEERLDPKYVRYSIDKDDALVTENGSKLLSTLKENELIKGIISPKQSHKYKLKIWVDNEADEGAMNKAFRRKLRIEGEILEVDGSCFVTNGSAITGYNTKDSEGNDCPKDVVIPSSIRGLAITSIGYQAFAYKKLTSVIIPSTITSIGDQVFLNNSLTSISIPNSVTKIGYSAFANNQLTHIEIPPSVTSIGIAAFKNNQMSDEEAIIYNRKKDGTIDNTSLNSYAGANRKNLVVPLNVETIGNYAYEGIGLNSISLPEGLIKIGTVAFANNQLTELKIPRSVTSLDATAFSNNYLRDEDAFIYKRTSDGEDRTYLLSYSGARKENIIIPSNVKVIGSSCFARSGIKSITIPNTVTSIGDTAFLRNNLTHIEIPPSVTSIGKGAFNGNQLSNEDAFIYQRNGDGTIDATTLVSYGGTITSNVIIPEGVKILNTSCFYEVGLRSITLPQSLEVIKSSAFQTGNFTTLTIPKNVITLEKNH